MTKAKATPTGPLSGPIFETLVAGEVITFCDGHIAGHQPTVKEIRRQLTALDVDEPTFSDVCAVAQDIQNKTQTAPAPLTLIGAE